MGFILLFLEASPCGAGLVQLRFTISFRTGLNTAPSCLPDAKHQLRGNVSTSALPGDFRDVLQRRLGDLERQLLRKVAELEDEKSLLHNETSAHRQKTESALNALLERVTELERGECWALRWLLCRPLAVAPPRPPPLALVPGEAGLRAGESSRQRGGRLQASFAHLEARPPG